MSEYMLLAGTIVLVATMTSIVFVLQVQRHRSTVFSAHWAEWENTRKHKLQMWEAQQEKQAIELEHSLTTPVQRVKVAWKTWEAKDTSLVASLAQQFYTAYVRTKLEQELLRLPYTDDVPLKELN